jgi:hypothetical protein
VEVAGETEVGPLLVVLSAVVAVAFLMLVPRDKAREGALEATAWEKRRIWALVVFALLALAANIAYARVKAYLTLHHPAPPDAPTDRRPHPHRGEPRQPDAPDKKPPRRSWVDHLFDTLNAFTGNRDDHQKPTASQTIKENRRHSFERVLDEMTGGQAPPTATHPRTGNAFAGRRRHAAGYRRCRRHGGRVGTVEGTERVDPVKPVSRVRGIGRNR